VNLTQDEHTINSNNYTIDSNQPNCRKSPVLEDQPNLRCWQQYFLLSLNKQN